ncbi:Putative two-component sensor histidine kinase [hydrothermal vent metagenome]|uniref:Putative two-component sensor histidine kinase n=1 Tax=hydrothermal vent metagenome TaxID=652676 RepID=A0A1W1BND6_9ZZZZ
MGINIDKYLTRIIGNDFYQILEDNPSFQPEIELYLESLNTSKYKNIILLDYNGSVFTVIADGNIDFNNRLVFGENFKLNSLELKKLVQNKEPISFQQDIKGFWQTYLYPILDESGNLQAILSIDFSIKNFNRISQNLSILDTLFYIFTILLSIGVFIIIIFSFMDYKRELKLKLISLELSQEINKVQELNNSLEKKVELKVREIKRSQKYFETIFNTTRDAIAVIDSQTKFLFVNKAYLNLTQLTDRELKQTTLYNLTMEEDREHTINIVGEAFRRGFYHNLKSRYVTKDNNILEISNDIVAMPDSGASFLLVTRDMTFENRLRREKEFQEQKLLQQSRLAQMGEMISMIAHQWRQPLAAIGASSAKMRIKAHLNKNSNKLTIESTEKIDSLIQHLSQTINDFRNFFKPDKIKSNISYTEMIDSVFDIVTSTISAKNITITKSLNTDDKMNIYVSEVKQVILNLLKNAEDALLDNEIENPVIKIYTYRNKNMLILEVIDNAGGIPENIIDKIFDPYFSTKKEKNGTGLGLYMSKTIIEEHCGGQLSVCNTNNEEGKGAIFKISMHKA